MNSKTNLAIAKSVPATSEISDSLLESFFEGRNEQTLKAYRSDLDDFRVFLRAESLNIVASQLLGNGHGPANQLVLSYRAFLTKSQLQPTTINRRLSSIRSLVSLARTLGMVSWELEVKNLKTEPYRDTRGPGLSNFTLILNEASRKKNAKAARDYAILRLLYDLALRASEVINLDIEDLDLDANKIAILGKGHLQKERLTLPEPTKLALRDWLSIRHDPSGSLDALFLNFDRRNKGQPKRLTRVGLYQLVRGLGEKLNIKTRPHGIRHTSITEAVKLAQQNGYGLEEVLDHSRHANVSTLMIYRDRDENLQGKIAELVAGTVSSKSIK